MCLDCQTVGLARKGSSAVWLCFECDIVHSVNEIPEMGWLLLGWNIAALADPRSGSGKL
jgi:Zn-finger protein